jgi:predicted signal transduction protein with EAL and GGDEF domain
VSTKLLSIGFLASIAVCLISMGWTFGSINPWYYTLLSILLSIPMAVVGIRSLAETDYNPESALGALVSSQDLSANTIFKCHSWSLPSSYHHQTPTE